MATIRSVLTRFLQNSLACTNEGSMTGDRPLNTIRKSGNFKCFYGRRLGHCYTRNGELSKGELLCTRILNSKL